METIIERAEIPKKDHRTLFEEETRRAIRKARDALLALQHSDG
jgi:hypothetical protein